MDCNFCQKKQASIFLSQIFKGKVIKLDLCEACAKQLEVSDVHGIAVNELIQKIKVIQQEEKGVESPACPSCGFTLSALRKSGRLGCPECYLFFGDELKETLQGCQKSLSHSGKIPRRARDFMEVYNLSQLEQELKDAIREENFESAACLRDRIRQAQSGV